MSAAMPGPKTRSPTVTSAAVGTLVTVVLPTAGLPVVVAAGVTNLRLAAVPVAVAALESVTVLAVVEATVVSAAMPGPKTRSPATTPAVEATAVTVVLPTMVSPVDIAVGALNLSVAPLTLPATATET